MYVGDLHAHTYSRCADVLYRYCTGSWVQDAALTSFSLHPCLSTVLWNINPLGYKLQQEVLSSTLTTEVSWVHSRVLVKVGVKFVRLCPWECDLKFSCPTYYLWSMWHHRRCSLSFSFSYLDNEHKLAACFRCTLSAWCEVSIVTSIYTEQKRDGLNS